MARSVVLLLFLCCLTCAPAQQFFSLFPLFYWYQDDQHYELYLLHPFFELKGPEPYRCALHPLFSYAREQTEQQMDRKELYFLYPLSYYKREAPTTTTVNGSGVFYPLMKYSYAKRPEFEFWRFTLLPLLFMGKESPDHFYFILFPLFWWAKEAAVYLPFYSVKRQSFFALFPLYGRFKNLWARDTITFFLWPLWSHSRQQETRRYNVLWPFIKYVRRPDAWAVRLFPLFAYAQQPEQWKLSLLWPFIHLQKKAAPSREHIYMVLPFWIDLFWRGQQLKYYFPFYGERTTRRGTTKGFFPPLFVSRQLNNPPAREWGILFPFIRYRPDSQKNILEVFPFFGQEKSPTRKKSYVLWPFYNHFQDEDERWLRSRRYLVPLWLSKTEIEKSTSAREQTSAYCPFFYRHDNEYRREEALWPLCLDRRRGMELNLNPLWRVYLRDEKSGTLSIWERLFFKQRAPAPERKEWNLLLFSALKTPQKRAYHLLGGLLGWESTEEQNYLRLFYLRLKFF